MQLRRYSWAQRVAFIAQVDVTPFFILLCFFSDGNLLICTCVCHEVSPDG